MQVTRNISYTSPPAGTSISPAFPLSPAPLNGGGGLLILFLAWNGLPTSIDFSALTGAGWTQLGSTYTDGAHLTSAVLYKASAADSGTTGAITWTGTVGCDAYMVERYSSQGTPVTLAAGGQANGNSAQVNWPAQTFTHDSTSVFGLVQRDSLHSFDDSSGPIWISYPKDSALSAVLEYGVAVHTNPPASPFTSMFNSAHWLINTVLSTEATDGDAIFTGVALPDDNFTTTNNETNPTPPSTAMDGDVLVIAVSQTQIGGSQATGQVINGGANGLFPGTNHGTPTSVSSVMTGDPSNNASEFVTASSQYVQSQAGVSRAFRKTHSMSIEGWFTIPTTSVKGCLAYIGDDTHGFGVGIGNGSTWASAGNILLVSLKGVGYKTSSAPGVSATALHYFCITYDASGAGTLTVDGTDYSVASGTMSAPISTSSAWVGSDDGTADFLTATVQDVAFYPYPLTATQRANHYLAGTTAPSSYVSAGVKGGNGPGGQSYDHVIKHSRPKIYWKLNDGGTTNVDSSPQPTHIRQDNDESNQCSLDLFWDTLDPTLAATLSTGELDIDYTFLVPNNCESIQGQIWSIGNIDNSTPVEASDGAVAPGSNAEFVLLPVMPAGPDTGVLMYFHARNLAQGNNVLPPFAWPVEPLGDFAIESLANSFNGPPVERGCLAYGAPPDFAGQPPFLFMAGTSAPNVKAAIALKAANTPADSGLELDVNQIAVIVTATGNSGGGGGGGGSSNKTMIAIIT